MLDHEFNLRSSKQYISLLTTVLLFSVGIFLCLPIAILFKACGFILLSAYGSYLLWNNGLLRSKHSITALKYDGDGRWRIFMHNKILTAELRGDSTVTGLVSVLRFRLVNRRLPLSCVVFKDSLQTGHYRQLLVVLKMG